MGRHPTCGTGASQVKQNPRSSSDRQPDSLPRPPHFSFQPGSVLFGGLLPKRVGSSLPTALAFPPDTARHTPLDSQGSVFFGATISESKLQTHFFFPKPNFGIPLAATFFVATSWSGQPGQRLAPRITCLTPQSPPGGPHSRVLLSPEPWANLSSASRGRPSRLDATWGSSGQEFCSSQLPSATSTLLSPTGRRHP